MGSVPINMRLEFPLIPQHHLYFIALGHHVIVRDDIAIGIDDDPGPHALLPASRRPGDVLP